jgi:tetratricopeptide (TPR) repeat protein
MAVTSKAASLRRAVASETTPIMLIVFFLLFASLPRADRCCVLAGNAMRKLGIGDGAVWAYNCATEINDRSFEGWMNMTILLAQKGELRSASTASVRAIAVCPPDIEIFSRLVTIKEASQPDSTDLQIYRRALALKSEDADGWFKIGSELEDCGERKGAELAYKRSLKLAPLNAQAWFGLGNAVFDLSAELEAYENAIKLDPHYFEAWYALGRALVGTDNDSAEQALNRSLMIQPGYAPAWHELANVRRLKGDLEGAGKAQKKAQENGWVQQP